MALAKQLRTIYAMSIITTEMKQAIAEQRLGYVATASPDGIPNLSPKGTLIAWGEDQLVFADIRSPQTISNLEKNPHIEINVVNPFTRKGFRFKGTATILTEGDAFKKFVEHYNVLGLLDAPKRIQAIAVIQVYQALPLLSPAYERGLSEADISEQWSAYYWKTLKS